MKSKRKISLISVVIIIFAMIFSAVGVFAWRALEHTPSLKHPEVREGRKYNILVLGKDKVAALCDIMVLVSFDTENGEVFALQIPRDTYLRYTDKTYKKINGALSHFGGEEALIKALEGYFDVPIDFYASVDTEGFELIVDTLGGIEIEVPETMRYFDPYQDFSVELEKGKQTLNGKQALGFVRYRESYLLGDLTRIDAQKLFAAALVNKITEQKSPIVLYNLFKALKSEIKTNLSPGDMIYFARHLLALGKENMQIVTLPGEAVQSEKSGAWYYVLSRRAVSELLFEHFSLLCEQKDFDKAQNFVDIKTKSFYDIYNKFYKYKPYRLDEIEREGIELT